MSGTTFGNNGKCLCAIVPCKTFVLWHHHQRILAPFLPFGCCDRSNAENNNNKKPSLGPKNATAIVLARDIQPDAKGKQANEQVFTTHYCGMQ
jgi:hypothetical protein